MTALHWLAVHGESIGVVGLGIAFAAFMLTIALGDGLSGQTFERIVVGLAGVVVCSTTLIGYGAEQSRRAREAGR